MRKMLEGFVHEMGERKTERERERERVCVCVCVWFCQSKSLAPRCKQ